MFHIFKCYASLEGYTFIDWQEVQGLLGYLINVGSKVASTAAVNKNTNFASNQLLFKEKEKSCIHVSVFPLHFSNIISQYPNNLYNTITQTRKKNLVEHNITLHNIT